MSATLAVLEKDLRLLWRQRAGWISAATFAMTSVLVYAFAFDLATGSVRTLLPGVLWVTFLFAGIISAGRSFATEAEQGTFDALLLAPVSRTALYAGKVLSNLIALLAVEAGVLLLATVMFNEALLTARLIAVTIVGTTGYVALTTLLSTLGARVRAREVLLPVLALPLLVPLLIGAVRATGEALGASGGDAPWLLLLTVFTLWAGLGSALLFPLLAER